MSWLWVIALVIASMSNAHTAETTAKEFLAHAFEAGVPKPKVIWITKKLSAQVEEILSHRYPQLRIRYWRNNARSAWILEEIGKEKPITVGIVVENGKIDHMQVLKYRESRGGEVQHRYFLDQFQNSTLTEQNQLNVQIDSISGATLSVRALKRLATLALFLDQQNQ